MAIERPEVARVEIQRFLDCLPLDLDLLGTSFKLAELAAPLNHLISSICSWYTPNLCTVLHAYCKKGVSGRRQGDQDLAG